MTQMEQVLELIEVTLEALADGRVTGPEAEAILACAGAVVAGHRAPADLVRLVVQAGVLVGNVFAGLFRPDALKRADRLEERAARLLTRARELRLGG